MHKVSKLTVVSQSLNLLVVNVPFLAMRLYLWGKYNYELSLFVVKNACYIFLLVNNLTPGMLRWFGKWKFHRDKVNDFNLKKDVNEDHSNTQDQAETRRNSYRKARQKPIGEEGNIEARSGHYLFFLKAIFAAATEKLKVRPAKGILTLSNKVYCPTQSRWKE